MINIAGLPLATRVNYSVSNVLVSYSSLGFYTYYSGPSNSDTGGFWVTDE